MENQLINYRKAAQVHINVRKKLKLFLKPGILLLDICEFIENNIKKELYNEVNNGIAFPVGVSLNNIAAHWTPMANDKTILKENDVLKIDYGTHINGNIIDSAFTYTYTPKYDKLLEASKEAVYNIIKNIGIDSRICELGAISEEIIKSYELEIDNKMMPLIPINNIHGHSIEPWKIHGTKFIKNVKNNDNTKIEENDILAIEAYVTTGCGTTIMDKTSSHFMLKPIFNINNLNNIKFKRTKELYNYIKSNFKTLPFTQRYIDIKHIDPCLTELFNNNIINSYPPLLDPIENSLVAQYEHTIHVSENNIEVFTKADDY